MTRLITLLGIFLTLILSFSTVLYADDDTQFWNDSWFYLPKFSDENSAGYINTIRMGRNVSDLVDRRHAIFFTHKHSPLINLTGQLAYIEQLPGGGSARQKQYRPTLDLHGALDFDFIKIPYRLRIERHFRESRDDRWNFRPRIGIEKSFEIDGFHPYIFATTEAFYGSDTRNWFRARSLAGVGLPLLSFLTVELYGGVQHSRQGGVPDLSLAGIVLKIKP